MNSRPALTERINWEYLRYTALALLVLALAFEPMLWLTSTWVAPGYAGLGWLPCLAVVSLLLWSCSSPKLIRGEANKIGFVVLAATACLRIISQVLDINVIGALLLCVDVYGIAVVLGVAHRDRSLSPFWLACLFAFCLPLEPMMQRVLGYGLQQVSAYFACELLSLGYPGLQCQGTRLTLKQIDLFVDLPCSGAQLLSTAGCVYAFMCALRQPTLAGGVLATIAFVGVVLGVNALRIAILGVGLAEEEALNFSVMQPSIHEAIGLGCVLLVALAMHWLLANIKRQQLPSLVMPSRLVSWFSITLSNRSQTLLIFALLPLALSIGALKPRPLDITSSLPPLPMPAVAADFLVQEHELTRSEKQYFTAFGGAARRSSYGPFGLLLVSTKSPLRHLHDPMICMTANGFEIDLVGTDHRHRTTVYNAFHPEQGTFVLLVSYVSASGVVATSVSEVVWRWFTNPEQWTMVQRIVPIEESQSVTDWDHAVRRAFNV